MIPVSILDLSPIVEGGDAAQSLRNSVDLVQHAEALGYHRYWVAEHHNMPGIASAATAVLMGQLAAHTQHIRIGSGGIMLPNHSPLVIAEQFGTLASLYGDRIDLGVGRAPGTDLPTARALRRGQTGPDHFPQDVSELIGYFAPEAAQQHVRAIPGCGTGVPVWILGSSLYGAHLAAQMGLPYAFASHFAPGDLSDALRVYRERYVPSPRHPEPRAMMAINVFAAKTDAEGERLKTSMQQSMANLRLGRPGPLPRPVDDIEAVLGRDVHALVSRIMEISVAGGPDTVRSGLAAIIDRFAPDEILLNGNIHDHAARRLSFEIASDVLGLRERATAA